MGFGWLHDAMVRAGEIVEVPITSAARKVPAYWNIASATGSPVAVVGWWGTWPAEPVLGEIASDRILDAVLVGDAGTRTTRLTFPDDLFREIAPLVVRPGQIPYSDTRRFMDWPEAEFEVVRAAPRWSRKDIETDLLCFLSSHETARRLALHLTRKAPDGIVLAAGPAFRPGRYDGLRVQDIFPLLARLKGLPIAADLAGRVPEELFDPRFLQAQPRQTIASYGPRSEFPIGEGPAAVDREMIERLKGLGYIQ